jgi:hypothetical protein
LFSNEPDQRDTNGNADQYISDCKKQVPGTHQLHRFKTERGESAEASADPDDDERTDACAELCFLAEISNGAGQDDAAEHIGAQGGDGETGFKIRSYRFGDPIAKKTPDAAAQKNKENVIHVLSIQ